MTIVQIVWILENKVVLRVEDDAGSVDLDFVGVGEAHVVAVDFAQVCVAVARCHEFTAFKFDFRQREYVG